MRIKNLHIKNFRCILDESLSLDPLTALVGPNGSGKSSFLKAIQLFYDPAAKVTESDFYDNDITQDIEIAVTFADLDSEARELFSSYMQDENLTVVRIFSDPTRGKTGTYHGVRLQSTDFADARRSKNKTELLARYKMLREADRYSSLPTARSADQAQVAMLEWEAQNADKCRLQRDAGQFFGFTQVGQGYLGRFTRCIHVPAVREAMDDATERRGSVVTELMDLVVRKAMANRPEIEEFRARVLSEYKEVMAPDKHTELVTLQGDLSRILHSYVPEAEVDLQWLDLTEIRVPMPEAEVRLSEDNYASRVEAAGHGLQRALIMTMLQHLHTVREAATRTVPESNHSQLPSLVLTIEEPELYQHPSRQRHFASVLMGLTTESSAGTSNTQVIYATHSPLFVGLDRFNQTRVLRKASQVDGQPKVTRLKNADMASVAKELQEAQPGSPAEFTAETLRARLQAIMTPWTNEGFFAEVVVLVEGESDRAALMGIARSMELELDGLGVAIIPCSGKRNLDRPLVIFRQLDIPVYVVWDSDSGVADAVATDNQYLLRLLHLDEEDWPAFVGESAACFKVNLEDTLTEELGAEEFGRWMAEAQEHFGIPKKDQALKNPAAIQLVMERANAAGRSSTSLTGIVEKIVALRHLTESAP